MLSDTSEKRSTRDVCATGDMPSDRYVMRISCGRESIANARSRISIFLLGRQISFSFYANRSRQFAMGCAISMYQSGAFVKSFRSMLYRTARARQAAVSHSHIASRAPIKKHRFVLKAQGIECNPPAFPEIGGSVFR